MEEDYVVATVIHCADLHLTAGEEREYSFSVLEEIVALTRQERAQCLVISGDLFDSFADARELRASFRECIAPLNDASIPIIYVPGNHEELRRGRGDLAALDLGPVTTGYKKPFQRMALSEDVELLCIPHQSTYRGYQEWDVPAKRSRYRVAVAHGLVTGMDIYAGVQANEEIEAGAIDPDLFVRHEVDYAAMGHIHAAYEKRFGETFVRYSGSARVRRRGEDGEHGVTILRLGSQIVAESRQMMSAGCYREYRVPLSLEGHMGGTEDFGSNWGSRDWVDIYLSGVVENENVVATVETALRERCRNRVRRLDIHRELVRPLPGIASQPVANKFLQAWAAREPGAGDERARRVWYKARELGLDRIVRVLEAR
ncbi:MAG: hypothetical protein GF344_09660 [Chitinivibrionales bacterium]|nr:hypothetical protein [Chitinivibrionales bacterium]MBD3357108.1 hypothetical protein [Chitinivibrionales bacterium]